MRTHQIAVLAGDGIGAEVMAATQSILVGLAQICSEWQLEFVPYPMGAGEYLKNGNPLPDATLAGIQQADAILLGAMGLPDVRWPDGTEMVPQIEIREILDLYAGERPLKLYHEAFTPLKGYAPGDVERHPVERHPIDILLIRENTEGLFWNRKQPLRENPDFQEDIMHVSLRGAERISRYALQKAQKRRQKVTLVDKANVLKSSAFFRKVFLAVAQEFPEIETECVYVDAFVLYLVQRPHTFDVVVTENMFGDILSDLGAGLVGGMGLAPSADIGEAHAVFQPSHGTAPDIAGKGIANPAAMILSAAMMLDYLGETQGAQKIHSAVEQIYANPNHATKDLGGHLSTQDFTSRLLAILERGACS